jgi:hypothetical protein
MKSGIKFILFFFVCYSAWPIYGQNSNVFKGGATTNSIGGVSNLLQGLNALYHNPAGLNSFNKSIGVDVSFENKYGLAGLNTIGIGCVKKSGLSTFAVGLAQYGIAEYKEQNGFLTYARPLLENLSVGATINYNQLKITEYGTTSFFSFNLGIQTKINKNLRLAGSIHNFLQTENKASNSPAALAVGLAYAPSDKVELMVEFQKIEDRPLSPKLAVAYQFLKTLELRIGSDISKGEVGFGMGYHVKDYLLRLGYSSHQNLGGSYGVTMQGSFD